MQVVMVRIALKPRYNPPTIMAVAIRDIIFFPTIIFEAVDFGGMTQLLRRLEAEKETVVIETWRS